MESVMPYTGMIASVWIVTGIFIASLFYPGYSHARQFCSELGAKGSPTQILSPVINNAPLGALFVLYGFYLITTYSHNIAMLAIGGLIIAHGIGTWICGIFPMDADPYTTQPTNSCKIHSLAGVVMLLSFLIAPAIVVFSSSYSPEIRMTSLLSIIACVFFSSRLATAYKDKTNPGVYQRLSYGAQIIWLFTFSLAVLP